MYPDEPDRKPPAHPCPDRQRCTNSGYLFIFVIIHIGEISVNHIVLRCAFSACRTALLGGLCLGFRLGRLVKFFRHFIESLLGFFSLRLYRVDVGAFEGFFQLVDLTLNLFFLIFGNLIADVFQGFFGLVNKLIGIVADIDTLAVFLILSGKLLRLLDSTVDVVF